MIVHREYTNAQPATFIIYGDRVETENANNPHGEGFLTPTNFSPFPKNPSIAKFFMQLGRFDELGSGILNVYKYIEAYSGKNNPQFIEGATFKTIIPTGGETEGTDVGVIDGVIDGVIVGVTKGVRNKLASLLKAVADKEGKRIPFYKEYAKFDDSDRTLERYMQQLREADLVEFRGEAPKIGGYFLKDSIKQLLDHKKM